MRLPSLETDGLTRQEAWAAGWEADESGGAEGAALGAVEQLLAGITRVSSDPLARSVTGIITSSSSRLSRWGSSPVDHSGVAKAPELTLLN